MNGVPSALMKEYVNSQTFRSTSEIMLAMKELFRDVIQQVMESELDAELGYKKSERTEAAVEVAPKNNQEKK